MKVPIGILASRLPDFGAVVEGIPQTSRMEVVQDPDTGLAMLGVAWQQQGTLDTYVTIALLYGLKAGAQGGAGGSITDHAGHWVKTA